ncbi:MAG: type II toxin-antitoxin system VapC family toxin, partial [Luteolibacter sp.]
RRGITGRADAFLATHPDESFFITFTVAGELACGQSANQRTDWERLCRPYPMLSWSPEVSWQYGEIYRSLATDGRLIGANDMWIAATARALNMPVVTNNKDEFERVPGLVVIGF